MDRHTLIAGPHLATAIAYYFLGLVLIYWALRVWWMHPVNRAFLFGPYLTEEGLSALLRNWMFVFLFGAFIFSCGIEHHLDYLASKGSVDALMVRFFGIFEAIIAAWTAISLFTASARAIFNRRKGL